jgi:tetratricopeptide (TPR) repeat protein
MPTLCLPCAGGTNAHLWAAWAYLAAKLGNVSLARKLYDAAIVAAPTHAAAWHGWGLLEKQQGNFLRARDLWLKGIQTLRKTGAPNPYLYQSLAVLAAEMDCVEESRKWFREGTRTVTVSWRARSPRAWVARVEGGGLVELSASPSVHSSGIWPAWCPLPHAILPPACRPCPFCLQGRASHALWQAWALMEQKQGDRAVVRALFRRGIEVR